MVTARNNYLQLQYAQTNAVYT